MRKLFLFFLTLLVITSTASAGYTLTVGPHEKYKTIQSAMNSADDGATIIVKAGTYKENVNINREVYIYGVGYPTVYGFYSKSAGPATINGFKIIKNGVSFANIGDNYIRNNYFYNCGISISKKKCNFNTIMNNQFSAGGMTLSESMGNSITGNKINKASVGIKLINGASCYTITKNTLQHCKVAVQVQSIPKCLIGNTYKGNKVNIKIVK